MVSSNFDQFDNEFEFLPYQHVGILKFKEDEKEIKLKLGKIEKEFDNYDGGKTIVFENFNNISIYLDSENKLYGIHFFKSIKILLKDKLYEINFDKFNKNDLIDIADDFIKMDIEEGVSFNSEKLGMDFYFNDDAECLEAVLFMSEDYYKNEIIN